VAAGYGSSPRPVYLTALPGKTKNIKMRANITEGDNIIDDSVWEKFAYPEKYVKGEKMLIKAGVDISRLNREIRRSLHAAETAYSEASELFIVTSTYEGNHGAGSLHYSNDAFDSNRPKQFPGIVAEDIKSRLGPNYDVVLEYDHIHIEYDPK